MMKTFFKKSPVMLPVFSTLVASIPFGCSFFIPEEIFPFRMKICIFIVFLVITLLTNTFSHSNVIMERKQNDLSTEILCGEQEIIEYRYKIVYEMFQNAIKNVGTFQKLNYNPEDKISFILKTLVACFEGFLEHDSKYISTAVIYHFGFDEENKWTRLGQNYFKAYEDNQSVITDSDSFGKYVMEGTQGFYFLNDKFQDGVKKGIYKLNDKDKETEEKFHKYGSIIGIRIGIAVKDTEYIRALLTISTYGKQIDNVPFGIFREKIEKELEENILPIFKTNIESELMQLYLKEIDMK